jgi:hypothetical protein
MEAELDSETSCFQPKRANNGYAGDVEKHPERKN